MTDLDLARIDAAFADFATVAGPHVEPPGPDAVAATYRHRRRTRAIAAAAVAVVLVAPAAGYAAWHGHRSDAAPGPLETARPTPVPSLTDPDQGPNLPTLRCTVSTMRLPAGLGVYTSLLGMVSDPTGRVQVGTFGNPAKASEPIDAKIVIWDRGTPSIVPVPTAYGDVIAVNSSGMMIGGGANTDKPGWVYRDGELTPLPTVSGWTATPEAIDAAGNVVGYLTDKYLEQTAVYWRADQPGKLVRLGATPAGDADNTYYWDTDGTLHALVTPPGDSAGAVSVIGPDWILGYVREGDDTHPYATIWNKVSGVAMVVPWKDVYLRAVNPSEVAVGDALWNGQTQAVIERAGTFSLLPSASAPKALDPDDYAVGISTDGTTIYGMSYDKPVIWHC